MYEELFYRRLSELRMEKGVSARDMSLSLGQSAGYINGLENRKRLPSLTVFFYICEYFGVTPSEFFDEGNHNPAKLKELEENLKNIKEEYLDSISILVEGLKSD